MSATAITPDLLIFHDEVLSATLITQSSPTMASRISNRLLASAPLQLSHTSSHAQRVLVRSLLLLNQPTITLPAPRNPSIARSYATGPGKPSGISGFYNKLVKKSLESSKWEFNDYGDSEEAAPYVATARKLKETLAASPNSNTLDFDQIKTLLAKLLSEIPQFTGTPQEKRNSPFTKHQRLIENSFSVLLANNSPSNSALPQNLTPKDIELLYRLMVEKTGSIFSGSGKSPIIPNLFSLLHIAHSQQSTKDPKNLSLYLLYFKFLSAHTKELEAKKLLDWLMPVYHPERDSDTFNLFLHAISQPSILKTCIPHLFSHAAASSSFIPSEDAFLFAIRQFSLLDSTASLKLTKQLFKSYPSLYSSAQITSLILSVLNNNIRQAAESKAFVTQFLAYHNKNGRTLATIDQALTFKDDAEKLSFHKSLALTLIKYDVDSSTANSEQIQTYLNEYIPQTFQQQNSQDVLDIELYKGLAFSISESSTSDVVIALFQKAMDSDLEVDSIIINNSLDILMTHKFNITENFDAIHNFFIEELGFESDIDTFESLILGALNNAANPKKPSKTDVESAVILFEKSIQNGTSWNKGTLDHLETLDKLILALCKAIPDDVFKVFKTYQKVRMFTQSVGYPAQVALLKLFLSYNYVGDCEKFLEDELGTDKRDVPWEAGVEMYQTLFNYACKSQSYKDAWLIYGLSEKYFDAPYESYSTILKHFCSLERPDAALLIFKNLRNKAKVSGSKPPSSEMYELLFREFGKVGYELGVSELYIFFKMDITVEPNISLLNEVMNAFTELEDFSQAVELWSRIKEFPGGPNNDSYTTVLKLCTHASIQDVEHMWESLKLDENVQINEANYRQYVIANCYHGFYARALEIAKTMEIEEPAADGTTRKRLLEPSEATLSNLYNWTMIQARKDDVKAWAQENFPEKWARLENGGSLKTYLLDEENKDNDSESNLRRQVIEQMQEDQDQEIVDRRLRLESTGLPQKQ